MMGSSACAGLLTRSCVITTNYFALNYPCRYWVVVLPGLCLVGRLITHRHSVGNPTLHLYVWQFASCVAISAQGRPHVCTIACSCLSLALTSTFDCVQASQVRVSVVLLQARVPVPCLQRCAAGGGSPDLCDIQSVAGPASEVSQWPG